MSERPNILFLLSDQHSPRVMGCAGDPTVRTPHLDALAESGVMFENAHCGSPLCVPSRMSMMTGRHCSDIDVWTNSCFLSSNIPTFCHSLGAAGYENLLAGRMHFMGADQMHGFHRRLIGDVGSYAIGGPGPNFINIPRAGCGMDRACVEVAGPGRSTYQAYDDAVLEACEQYLTQRAHDGGDRPFFLTAGFVLPHCPFVAPKKLYDYYYENLPLPQMPEGYFADMPPAMQKWREERGIHDLSEEEIRAARAGYYGLVEYFDGIVGRLMARLEATGLLDNTIVIYSSDHGESAGENGLWWKGQFYQSSVGVPFIVSAPGRFPAGLRRRENISLLDLGPTLIEITGGPPLPPAAGQSILPLIEGECMPERPDEVMAELIDLIRGYAPGRMLRRGPWKLIHYEGFEPILFNLDEDPGEFTDRASDPSCRAIRDSLHSRLLQGWDPYRAIGKLHENRQYLPLLGQWRRAWHDAPPDPHYWRAPDDHEVWPER